MILVKSIEVIHTKHDPVELVTQVPYACDQVYFPDARELCSMEFTKELIHGRRFIRPDGEEVCIGMSEQAADIIGIQYEAWGSLQRRCEAEVNLRFKAQSKYEGLLKNRNAEFQRRLNLAFKLERVKSQLKRIRASGFFRRLKFLISGVI